jgi:hypothetical protein
LVVYSYARPGHKAPWWAVATGDKPEDVVLRAPSKERAIKWAESHSDKVTVES